MSSTAKVLLCVLDGFGHGPDYPGNALTRAKAPFLKELYQKYPWTLLNASGEAVGIPAGTQGGSEVGHLTMGAGRIVLQPLLAIDQSIADGSFFKKPALLAAAAHARQHHSAFHILGMISDQGVHADLDHCLALLDFAQQQGLTQVYIHAITDGRDVPPKSAATFIRRLQEHIATTASPAQLATLIGRYYAMDRDKNWDRTEVAYQLLTGQSPVTPADPLAALDDAYTAGLESDYYLKPIRFALPNLESALIHSEDAVVFFNFRTDRAAQLTERLISPAAANAASTSPAGPSLISPPYLVVFGPYTTKAPVVFPEPKVPNNLGSVLAQNHLRQLRIAETEKYAHVTFFFNSQVKEPFHGETRLMIDSPKCASYADQPEMSAPEITAALLKELQAPEPYSFIALNFANLDLVGHSGNFAATVKAVETIDHCLSQIVPAALTAGYTILLTGDHGNAEYMIYDHSINPLDDPALDGTPCPSHTRNPVPLIFISNGSLKPKIEAKSVPVHTSGESAEQPTIATAAGLQDLAPTILTLLGLPVPVEMTGQNLLP